MKRCKHRCPYDVSSVDILNEPEPRISLLGQRRCMDCGEVVPYGPANDLGPHAASVATEVRAAEIAELWHDAELNDEETRGWSMAETNMREHTDAWHAGCLARVIATHTEGE